MSVCLYLQVVGFEKAREPFGRVGQYHGMVDCFVRIAKEEGLMAFYKGTSVAILKVRDYIGSRYVNLLVTLFSSCTALDQYSSRFHHILSSSMVYTRTFSLNFRYNNIILFIYF